MAEQAFARPHVGDGAVHVVLADVEQAHRAGVVVHLHKPVGVTVQELVGECAVELRGGEVALDFGCILGESLPNHVAEAGAQVQEQQVEAHHGLVDELTRACAQRQKIDVEHVFVEGKLVGRGGQGVAVGVAQAAQRHADKLQRCHGSHKLHEVRVVALPMLARVIEVGVGAHLVAHIEDGVHVAVVGTGEGALIVIEGALCFDDEVAGGDARVVLAALQVEVGQHGESAYWGTAQGVAVLDAFEVGGLADVLHHDGKSGCSRSAEDGTDEEDAVALLEHVGERLELVAVLDFVQGHTADVGRPHEADVHVILELVVGKE